MTDSQAYAAVVKAVNGRWRRCLLGMSHLIIASGILMQIAYTTSQIETYLNFETGLDETFTYTLYTFKHQTPLGIACAVIVALHLLYIVFAELRDRAIRRGIERERKW
jgi:hypothetical protein